MTFERYKEWHQIINSRGEDSSNPTYYMLKGSSTFQVQQMVSRQWQGACCRWGRTRLHWAAQMLEWRLRPAETLSSLTHPMELHSMNSTPSGRQALQWLEPIVMAPPNTDRALQPRPAISHGLQLLLMSSHPALPILTPVSGCCPVGQYSSQQEPHWTQRVNQTQLHKGMGAFPFSTPNLNYGQIRLNSLC